MKSQCFFECIVWKPFDGHYGCSYNCLKLPNKKSVIFVWFSFAILWHYGYGHVKVIPVKPLFGPIFDNYKSNLPTTVG